MVNLINFNTQIAVNDRLRDDPFTYLFLSHLPVILPLTGKTQYLKEFCVAIDMLEQHVENTLARNHWLCITSGFAAAITVAGSNALFPIGGMILSGAAVVAAATVIIESCVTKSQIEAIAQTLKRHRLALESQQTIQWAALWEYAQTDLFCRALSRASDGFVVESRLIQRGDDTPFQRAIDFVAECRGLEYIQVVEQARAVMNGTQSSIVGSLCQPTLPPKAEPTPTIEQNTKIEAIDPPVVKDLFAPTPTNSRSITAYSRILDCPMISRAFLGSQGTGKTYLAAVASYALQQSGNKIYHINLGSFGAEDDSYWGHASSVRGDLSALNANEAEYLIKKAITLVEEFYAQTGAILIVDEWAYIGSTNNAHAALLEPLMKILADKIAALSSTGIKRQKAIWAIAPEVVAGCLTNQAQAIKKLKLCYVSIAPGKFVDWHGNAIGFNAELFEHVKNNFPITSPEAIKFTEERVCFIDNKWLSLGELPSLPKFISTPTQPNLETENNPKFRFNERQIWDRFVLESSDDQINELIEQRRSKPDTPANDAEQLQTIDEQIEESS